MDQNEKFNFFAPIDFEQLEKAQVSDDKDIDVPIHGDISSGNKDLEGDEFDQSQMDFGELEKNGCIKYEHLKKGAVPTPENHIGFPEGTVPIKGCTYMVGRIFAKAHTPQHPVAKAFLGKLENVRAWNEKHPDNKKPAGFSLEGGVLRDCNGKFLKGVATDVVATFHPINQDSWCDLVKSFEAGQTCNKTELTGSEAGRIESLQGAEKDKKKKKKKKKKDNFINQIFKGARTVMKFTSKNEFKEWLVNKGFSEEDASKKADEWEDTQKSRVTQIEAFNKSIQGLDESIESVVAFANKLDEGKDIKDMKESFEKGIKDVPDDPDKINPVAFFKAIGENALTSTQINNDLIGGVIKSNGLILNTLKDVMEFQKSLTEKMHEYTDLNADLIEENELIRKSIAQTETAVTTQNLETEVVDTEQKGGDPVTEVKFPEHTMVKAAFRKALSSKEHQFDRSMLNHEHMTYQMSGEKHWEHLSPRTKAVITPIMKSMEVS